MWLMAVFSKIFVIYLRKLDYMNAMSGNVGVFVKSFLASIIGPLMVINPRTKNIFFTTLISMMGYSVMISVLLVFLHLSPEWLGTYQDHVSTFEILCYSCSYLRICDHLLEGSYLWVSRYIPLFKINQFIKAETQ